MFSANRKLNGGNLLSMSFIQHNYLLRRQIDRDSQVIRKFKLWRLIRRRNQCDYGITEKAEKAWQLIY